MFMNERDHRQQSPPTILNDEIGDTILNSKDFDVSRSPAKFEFDTSRSPGKIDQDLDKILDEVAEYNSYKPKNNSNNIYHDDEWD